MSVNLLFSPLKPTGGIAIWTYNMLEYIQKYHIPNIYHVNASIRFKNAKSRSQYRRLLSGVLDTVVLIYCFGKAIIKHKPNCVHVTTSAGLALYKDLIYLLIASFFKIKVVLHYRFGRIPALAQLRNGEWRRLVLCVKRAAHVIVIDPVSYAALCKEGFECKVSYVPNPCSPLVEAIARQPVSEKERGKFVFVGHVVATKGVYELVEAFTQLEENVILEMIGLCNDGVREDLMRIASRKGNGCWLSVVGNKDRDYVLGRMKEAEALVLPSYTEGFPNVVLEAMACGCPVLATNVGAIAEMLSVDSEKDACGICMHSHEVADVRDVVEQYLRMDEEGKKKIAMNGKKKILEAYTMEKVFPQYERCWNN